MSICARLSGAHFVTCIGIVIAAALHDTVGARRRSRRAIIEATATGIVSSARTIACQVSGTVALTLARRSADIESVANLGPFLEVIAALLRNAGIAHARTVCRVSPFRAGICIEIATGLLRIRIEA